MKKFNIYAVYRSPHTQVSKITTALWASLVAVNRAIGRRQEYQRQAAHLRSLSDHLLKDIGITHSQIFEYVYGRKGNMRDNARIPGQSGF